MTRRTERVGELLRKEVSWVIANQMADPRLPTLVSITRVDIAADLRRAKVFVSVMGTEDDQRSAMQMLQSAARFIQRELKPKLALRYVPALTFQQDHSLEEGARLLSIMDGAPSLAEAPVEMPEDMPVEMKE